MKYVLTIVLSCMIGVCQLSTAVAQPTKFKVFLDKGTYSNDSALFYFEKAREAMETPEQEQRLNYQISSHYFDLNKLDSAHYWIDKNFDSIGIQDSLPNSMLVGISHSHYLKRLLHIRESNYEYAIKSSLQAIQLLEKNNIDIRLLGSCYLNIGIDFWRINDFDNSLKWLNNSLKYNEKNDYKKLRIKTLISLGLVYWKTNKFNLAQEYYEYAVILLGQQEKKDIRTYLSVYNNLGALLNDKNQLEMSIEYYQKALELLDDDRMQKDYLVFKSGYRTDILSNMSRVYFKKEAYEKSLQYDLQIVEISENFFEKNAIELVGVYSNIAKTYNRLKNKEKALYYANKALRIGKIKKYRLSYIYNLIGIIHASAKLPEMALQFYDSALIQNNSISLNGITVYKNAYEYLRSTKEISILLAESSFDESDEILNLFQSIQSYLPHIYNETNDEIVFDELKAVLQVFYKFYFTKYSKTQKRECLAILWEISEISRSIKLKSQVWNEYAVASMLPKHIIEKERQLKDSLDFYLSRMNAMSFDSSVFKMKRKIDLFTREIEDQYPEYLRLRNALKTVKLEEVLAQIGKQEVIYHFFEGENYLYLSRLMKNTFNLSKVLKKEINRDLTLFNKALIESERNALIESAEKIKTSLKLNEVDLKNVNHINIYPAGELWSLQFGSLVTLNDGKASYLGNEYSIAYQYYTNHQKEEKSFERRGVAAFSYDDKSNESIDSFDKVNFRDLNKSIPGTAKEVLSISEIWNGDYYYSNIANESTFKNTCNQYNILHLAVHGYLDKENPENSYLKFNSQDSVNDGALHAYELYNLDLNANLVVLSACNSGDGVIESGEGMISLARSFAFSGAESMIASRWKVPDFTTPTIMKYFYKGLKNGMRKSEALKYAQLTFLRNDADNITSSPYYWSGFYLIGDDSPIEYDSEVKVFLLYMIIGIFLIGLLSLFLKKRLVNRL